jgi:hypothetical protein
MLPHPTDQQQKQSRTSVKCLEGFDPVRGALFPFPRAEGLASHFANCQPVLLDSIRKRFREICPKRKHHTSEPPPEGHPANFIGGVLDFMASQKAKGHRSELPIAWDTPLWSKFDLCLEAIRVGASRPDWTESNHFVGRPEHLRDKL